MRKLSVIKKEIKIFEKKLEKTPDNSPDVGHFATILIGLKGEYIEALRQMEVEKLESRRNI